MKLIHLLLIMFLIPFNNKSVAQKILLTQKPGNFNITYGTLNGQGPDSYMKSCGYTNTEAEAAKKNLVLLVDIFRRNPVLKNSGMVFPQQLSSILEPGHFEKAKKYNGLMNHLNGALR